MEREKIIIVDDNIANLTQGRNILKSFYEVFPAPSAAKMFEVLENILPDLILLDVEMPGKSGYDAIKDLKGNPRFKDIPVIFVTGMVDNESELLGFDLGAVDYIGKPFNPPLLLKRIEKELLFVRQTKELKESQLKLQTVVDSLEETVLEKVLAISELQSSIISDVAELVEFRDENTGGHLLRTKVFLRILIEEMMGQNIYNQITQDWDVDLFVQSSVLHDVGKIVICDSILLKPDKLTPKEFQVIKTHVLASVDVIERMKDNSPYNDFWKYASAIAGTHHEKWNGTGYPIGLRGENIPLEGRLMAIVDVYDALTSKRPYKKPFSHEDSYKIILEGSGEHFDPELVKVFKAVSKSFEAVNGWDIESIKKPDLSISGILKQYGSI
jgi:putative two-component system response regulator